MFKLENLALKTDSVLVQLRHPATDELLWADEEETKPVGIHVYGTASKEYRNAISKMQNRALQRRKKKRDDDMTADEIRAESVELLVAVSERGENLEYNGNVLDNASAFRELYSDAQYSWLKEQVDVAVGDTAAFLAQ